jgi:hypothetical protein
MPTKTETGHLESLKHPFNPLLNMPLEIIYPGKGKRLALIK